MRLGVTVWHEGVSPVLDAASEILLIDVDDEGRETQRSRARLVAQDIPGRLRELVALGMDALICGAVSIPLGQVVAGAGIELYPFVSGTVAEVVQAFLQGRIEDPAFAMPGCCARRSRHRWGGARPERGGRGGGRPSGGRRRGRGGAWRGRGREPDSGPTTT